MTDWRDEVAQRRREIRANATIRKAHELSTRRGRWDVSRPWLEIELLTLGVLALEEQRNELAAKLRASGLD